ncbi:MAG: M20/M25/M40 family metallo-hydrolase [Deltaproteobacteria bacterium]|nr:M20/M25/M40 family metallo-hydrolase [Deltaproteobacteria bacterium]
MHATEALESITSIFDPQTTRELLVGMVRVPSFQTDQFEADPQVRAFIAEWVRPRVAQLAAGQARLDAMGNLLWRMGPRDGTSLLLMGYAMTFPPTTMPDPFAGPVLDGGPYGIRGSCVWGRGVCEQKGPLAAMLQAVSLVAAAGVPLRGELLLAVSTAGETGRHDAARHLVEQAGARARLGVVGLGTGNRIGLGNKGRLDIEVLVHGRAAHSSAPWDGVDAIEGARAVMERLELARPTAVHPHLGPATLTKTKIESFPAAPHTVQDLCRIVLDRRLLPGEEPARVLTAIRQAVGEIPRYQVEVKPGALMYPAEVAADCAIARALAAAGQVVLGTTPDVFYSDAALDAGYLNRAGIETLMFGPGDLRFAHTDHEVIALAEVEAAAKILAVLALSVLA